MVTQGVREYLFDGLEATPVVLRRLLHDLKSEDPQWDTVHAANRFTLREMVAHVADWEAIFRQRIERTLNEDHPFLPSVDEGQLCLDRSYATQDSHGNLGRFSESRANLVPFLRSLPVDSWERRAEREFVGDTSLNDLIAIMLGHDAYHLRQAAEYVGQP